MRPLSVATIAVWLLVSQANADETYESPQVPPLSATGVGWEVGFQKATAFLKQLTLDEKAYIATGVTGPCVGNIPPIERLGFKGLCLQDGPLAIRQADYVSVFPAGLSAAASWDKDLLFQRGVQMGSEFRAKGSHIALGPVVGPLGRHALGGRNWEGFSPDPALTSEAVFQTITGMQSVGLQACVKHYIGNEQETQRNPSTANGTTIEAVSSNIDDRTMHELYSWPFASAVKAGASSVMCSYNRLNETYGCQNSKTLNGILKDELGFQGYVVSDWGATHSGVFAIQSGLDMDMPGSLSFVGTSTASLFGGNITLAVQNGTLSESRVDDMVLRILTPYFQLGQDNYPTIDPSSSEIAQTGFFSGAYKYPFNLGPPAHRDARADHAVLIRELGAASSVLLKNTDNTLPLATPPKVIAVFGNDAADETIGLAGPSFTSSNPYGWNIGTLFVGGGSGLGRATYIIPPLDAIKAWALPFGSLVQYITDNTAATSPLSSTIYPLPEVCFVFGKTFATEGSDRLNFDLDYNATAMINNVASFCNNTIVITHSAGANTLPWASNPNITAIIAAHLPGQETGNSIVDVITGRVNPSGKLPYTIAYSASDYNAPVVNFTGTTDPNAWQSDFDEKLLIDYRHFDSANITPHFEFGFGLSYTTFDISGLSVASVGGPFTAAPPASAVAPGGNPALWETVATATFTIKNTGGIGGATVAQLYVAFPQDTTPSGTPPQVLRAFEKIWLGPGQAVPITLRLTRKDLSYWDIVTQEWVIPGGSFTIKLGLSSRDIRATAPVSLL